MNKPNKFIELCPEPVGEWINEYMLPDLADGYHSAEAIAEVIIEQASSRLDDEKSDIEFYLKQTADQVLYDSWVVLRSHKQILIGYIQAVFDSWEEAGEPNE